MKKNNENSFAILSTHVTLWGIAILIVVIPIVLMSLCTVDSNESKELTLFGRPYAVKTVGGTYLINPLAKTFTLPTGEQTVEEKGQNLRTADGQLITVTTRIKYHYKGDDESVYKFFNTFKSVEDSIENYIKPNVRSMLSALCCKSTVEDIQNRGSESDLDKQIIMQANETSKKQDEEILQLKEDVRKILANEEVSLASSSSIPNEVAQEVSEEESSKKDSLKALLRNDLFVALKEFFEKNQMIEITDVSIMYVDFTNDYNNAINEKSTIISDIESQKFKFNGAIETARMQINEARGIANATLREDENTAEATKQRGKNEADAILATAKARAEGYKELSANLTPELIKAKALEKWDGNVPERVMVNDGGSNFMFQIPSKAPELSQNEF